MRRFYIDRDSDCHYYVIPVDKKEEFDAWMIAMDDYWSYDGVWKNTDIPEPTMPEDVISLSGDFSLVTFTDPVYG